jgi:hypothetical protein
MKKYVFTSASAVIIIFLITCGKADDHFSVSEYFDQQTQDSLMVNIVTYIGKKPRRSDYQTRYNAEYRKFYTDQAELFSFRHYCISADSVHFYYLTRPVRNSRENLRGAGGKFKLRGHLEIYDLEELFITPVLDEEELISKGKVLFVEMVRGNMDKYLNDKNYVEWPDERLKYDMVRNEWRYDIAYE